VEGKGWISAKDIKVGNKIGVPRQINLPEKEILLPYEFALDNLKKNSQICILYEDYLRLRNKTDNFNDLECLGTKDLYEIKTLTETSFSKLSKELDISLSGVYRLFNRETNHKKQLFFNLLKSKCRKIRFERNRVIVKSNGVKTFSFIYPEKVDVRLARWLSFVLAALPSVFLRFSVSRRRADHPKPRWAHLIFSLVSMLIGGFLRPRRDSPILCLCATERGPRNFVTTSIRCTCEAERGLNIVGFMDFHDLSETIALIVVRPTPNILDIILLLTPAA